MLEDPGDSSSSRGISLCRTSRPHINGDSKGYEYIFMRYTYPALFDPTRAAELSTLVNAAYDQQKQAATGGKWTSPVGYNIVATKGGSVYVVIRGTITPLEWFDDFTADPVPFQPNGQNWGQTPRGFSMLYADLGPQIITAFQTLQAAGTPLQSIFVTGHSLGAALAHLAAAGINAQFNVQPVSYTFSGPRAGDPAFAGAYAGANLPTWRMVNSEDIVPMVPPAAIELDTPNAGMHGLTAMTQALAGFLRLGAIGYQHIGYPIVVTFHCDSVANNHDMNRLIAEALSP